MQEFRIGNNGTRKLKKKLLIISVLAIIPTISLMIYYSTASSPDGTRDWTILFISGPIAACWIGFSMYRSFKKQNKALQDFCITITDDQVSLRQTNGHEHAIGFMEIKEIRRTAKGHYFIKGEGKGSQINIPSYIEDYADLEAKLSKLGPVTVSEKDPFYQRYGIVLGLLFLGLGISVYTVSNKIVVGIAGPLVIAGLVWSFYMAMINKAIPAKTKRSAWFILVVIASIIYIMYEKLSA